MSYSGNLTPMGINVLTSLSQDIGFAINSEASSFQGSWNPTTYSTGSIGSLPFLAAYANKLTTAHAAIGTTVTNTVYRNMLSIGSGICPALANNKPDTFKPTYAGYGNWNGATLLSETYPPKNYPVSGTNSYVYQTYGDYAFVTGWPGTSAWQKPTDTYIAAAPNTTESDAYFSQGFIATVARQAYYEMWSGQFNDTNNIVNSFSQYENFKRQKNTKIGSLVNSKTFMTGMFSNTDDLTTSDIAGVNQAFKEWGTDLINSGRSIDLSKISKFGLPSTLLRTLFKNSVITDPLKFSLLQNLSSLEVNTILTPEYLPTISQEKKLYDSFLQITGNDLHSSTNGIMYGLNCKTSGIETLADLLDPRKLFPNSYSSLTVPSYSLTTQRAKIYDFIYRDGGVNDRISGYGDYLLGILPPHLCESCGAFAVAMTNIKYISSMEIQKFSQVVAQLELTTLNLPLIDSETNVPVNTAGVDDSLSKIALGSGNSNSYRMCDFFGAASGYPYTRYYTIVQQILQQLPTNSLLSIYTTMPASTDAEIALFVSAANAEITKIYNNNKVLCDELNYYWDLIGKQLTVEQRAIPSCLPNSNSVISNDDPNNIDLFVNNIEQYALDTPDGESATVLSGISDVSTLGGQSLVAMMRESRNAHRLGLIGGNLQNDIVPVLDNSAASASVIITNGVITDVVMTSHGSGYSANNPPKIVVYPVGLGASLSPVLARDGSISSITVDAGGTNYPNAQIEISSPLSVNRAQQNYADSPYKAIVPTNLLVGQSSSPSVSQAITNVEVCNCDCWM